MTTVNSEEPQLASREEVARIVRRMTGSGKSRRPAHAGTAVPEPLRPKPATGPVALLIGSRKGAFILRGDGTRRAWRLSAPLFLGNIVHHLVLDPRDGRTILMAARTGHLGPTIFRSTDLGRTWREAKYPPAFPKAVIGQRGLVVDHIFWLSPGHPREKGVWYAGSSPPGLLLGGWQRHLGRRRGFQRTPLTELLGGGPPGCPARRSDTAFHPDRSQGPTPPLSRRLHGRRVREHH